MQLLDKDSWERENMPELIKDYHFYLTEFTNYTQDSFDEDMAKQVITFKDFCLETYLTYVDDFIADNILENNLSKTNL